MTDPTRAQIFDTTCLSHFARADRLDELADLVRGTDCRTTELVKEELLKGAEVYPQIRWVLSADWLVVEPLCGLEDLRAFSDWSSRLGAGVRGRGEASVFAVAERTGGIAICDDQDAVRVGRKYRISVHGTLWLLCRACGAGKLTEGQAGRLVDELTAHGMRLPCTGAQFSRWARRVGLL